MKYEGDQKFAYICFSILVPILSLVISLYLLVAVLASFLYVQESDLMNALGITIFVYGPLCVIFTHIYQYVKKDSLLKRLIRRMCDLEMYFFYIVGMFLLVFLLLHNGIVFVVDWWNR
ncbi:hypothetical protein P9384_06550 [Bacillus pumilus]|uniref:hypothetical protein n=1 Tax=Bacillus pumilus TaxID=1408 RepID=UPI000DE5A0E9|nr:hypothetical protein [Bacillus pumilus]MDM5318990.1 hypothetical protein [Bacillus pumilus]MED4628794.1 hypothetical protein [Bacillus pumilus]MED4675645.1 hypothetical protein [Bacillus pumilus]